MTILSRKTFKCKFIDIRTGKIFGVYNTREECRVNNKLSKGYMTNHVEDILTDVKKDNIL